MKSQKVSSQAAPSAQTTTETLLSSGHFGPLSLGDIEKNPSD